MSTVLVNSDAGGIVGAKHHSRQRAIAAVGIGNAVEWYDFAIYGSFAAVLGATFFPSSDPATQLLLAFAVYGTALVVRPLGALVFGRLGDVRGRRPAMTTVIVVMSLATAAVGLLPGYQAIGVAAPVLLVLLRALQGLGAGGELGVSSVFLVEHAPPGRRGVVGSLLIATLALGMAMGMVVAAALTAVDGGAALRSGWWRLAFLVALPLGLVGWYVRTRVSETSAYLGSDPSARRRPWSRLLRSSRSRVWGGFLIMGAGSLAYNTFFVFLPNHLIVRQAAPAAETWFITASGLVVTAVAAVVLGHLSDRHGRRRIVAGSAISLAVLAVPLSLVSGQSLGLLRTAQCLIGIGVGGVLSVALVAEAFPAEVRTTGVAMTAGLATALLGGTTPLVDQLLVAKLGVETGPGAYVAVVALIAALAVWRWDERRRSG
jgi:MHS family proline/betaine transporter-like MFS transporter